MSKRTVLYFLLVPIWTLSGCIDTGAMSDIESQAVVHQSIGDLDQLMVLPGRPISTRWSIVQAPSDSNDSGLVAVLHYTEEEYKEIIRNSEPHEVVTDALVNGEFYQAWVPEEVKMEFEAKPHGESVLLVGRPALKPNLFVNLEGSSPYIHGNIYPVGMGYIIVSLYTM